jgi:hypothetical protein
LWERVTFYRIDFIGRNGSQTGCGADRGAAQEHRC